MTEAPEDGGFLGQGWAFPPRFEARTGAATRRTAEADIVESLRILIATRPGERVMQPDYGCRLADLVFEPMTTPTRIAIEVAIRRAILFFEARIVLDRVEVTPVDWPGGRLEILVTYTIRATNARHNVVFPFYLSEGTLLSEAPLALEA
ncbi:MAG: GPW/gp25 family protein [Alkalilacustris sp.]